MTGVWLAATTRTSHLVHAIWLTLGSDGTITDVAARCGTRARFYRLGMTWADLDEDVICCSKCHEGLRA